MTDRRIFAILVGTLGFALLVCVIGVITLAALGKPVDDILKQAITGLITGLLGIFTRTPTPAESTPVHVVNDERDSIPVTPQP